MKKTGFDNDLYCKLQSEKIKERIKKFWWKLYLEFGGKLFDDYHASRVLPGFKPDAKINMLKQLQDDAEIVVAISAIDIENNKIRWDFWISYDTEVLRLIDAFRECGFYVGSVCITRFVDNPNIIAYQKKLESQWIKVYHHYSIPGYPSNTSFIVSDDWYGKNDYIETTKPLVVVTAPWPWSGKMAVCLSQIYHEFKREIKAWYAKFETFPVRDLPLNHPVNLAYEAATVDLDDVNMVDPFHLEAYGKTTVNYNRDVEIFPVLNAMFEKIMWKSPYKSPTDMWVNMIWSVITDNAAIETAAQQEIIRRYFKALCDKKQWVLNDDQIVKLQLLMQQAWVVAIEDRKTIEAARKKSELSWTSAVAIELTDWQIITGRTTDILSASAAVTLNALKTLAWIDDNIKVISEEILQPIKDLKSVHFWNQNPKLHVGEILIALSICAVTDEKAKLALEQLPKLHNAELHSTVILPHVDSSSFRKLWLNITCDPEYPTKKLYNV